MTFRLIVSRKRQRMTQQKATTYTNAKKRIAAHHRSLGASQEVAAGLAGYGREWLSKLETRRDPEYWHWYEQTLQDIKRQGYAEALYALRKGIRSADERVSIAAAGKFADIVAQSEERLLKVKHIGGDEGDNPVNITWAKMSKRLADKNANDDARNTGKGIDDE